MAENSESQTVPVENPDDRKLQSQKRGHALVRPTSFGRLSVARLEYLLLRAGGTIRQSIEHELDTGLGFYLVPVGLGLGIGLYFFAPAEPLFPIVCFVLAVLGVVYRRLESRGAGYYLAALVSVILLGMAVAQLAVIRTEGPSLNVQVTAKLTGIVLKADRNSRGSPRYVILVETIEGLLPKQTPRRVRVSGRSNVALQPGDHLSGLARLQPLSGPVFPGSYDFAFFGRFDGLGANGFFMGAPKRVQAVGSLPFHVRATIAVNRLRGDIGQRLETALPGPKGRIVTALVTGDKTGISDRDNDALRASGLAHILAISGLHMALVTLTVIWVIRLAMVGASHLLFRHPIKKVSALAGFAVATVYLSVSGAGIATQRAWIMVAVMVLAVLLDRKAITLRSVAISAVLILLMTPQSLFAPGFQMSFAAVTALVAGYEAYRRWQIYRDRGPVGAPSSFAQIWRFGSGLALTSLIAGSATLFISAYHFHQIATFGLLANVLAMPIVSLVLMPFILLAALLMPFGMEAFALVPVSYSLDWILWIATWVSGLTPLSNIGRLSSEMVIIFIVGFLLLVLLRTWLRLSGLAVLALLPLFYHAPVIPDLLIAESGRAAAWKSASGKFEIVFPGRENFVTGIWSKAFAYGNFKNAALSKEQCNRDRCILTIEQAIVHIVYDPDLLNHACERSDILIAPRLKWVNCRGRMPSRILKRHDFEQYGTHAIYLEPASGTQTLPDIRIETSLPKPHRPWHRSVPEYGD